MNVCVLSELSTLFKAIVSRCRDLPGVHFTQLEPGNEGEHSLVRGRIKYTGSKRDPHWVDSLVDVHLQETSNSRTESIQETLR